MATNRSVESIQSTERDGDALVGLIQDADFAIECPECHATPGRPCERDYALRGPHPKRIAAAILTAGFHRSSFPSLPREAAVVVNALDIAQASVRRGGALEYVAEMDRLRMDIYAGRVKVERAK